MMPIIYKWRDRKLPRNYEGLNCKVVTYGIIDSNYRVKNEIYDIAADKITFDNLESNTFDLYLKGQFVDRINLKALGVYNISNCLPNWPCP